MFASLSFRATRSEFCGYYFVSTLERNGVSRHSSPSCSPSSRLAADATVSRNNGSWLMDSPATRVAAVSSAALFYGRTRADILR